MKLMLTGNTARSEERRDRYCTSVDKAKPATDRHSLFSHTCYQGFSLVGSCRADVVNLGKKLRKKETHGFEPAEDQACNQTMALE